MPNKFDPNNKIVEKIITDTKYFVIFVLLGFIMFGYIIQKCNKDGNESELQLIALQRILKFEVQSSVVEKGKDSRNRNTPYIKFSNKEELDIGENFLSKVEVGDSISKKKNTITFNIFKLTNITDYDYLVDSQGKYNKK
ncbi:hypothetical protein [Chryseobacterium sp.]|uniref:hypothetical protein n=1 Tax=Chryseobacterium sp. TaxID=1871047 RepID=UPI00388E12CC